MGNASPLWEQVLFFILGPPIMALLIRMLSRGWANIVQNGHISEKTRERQKLEFWGVLALMYIMLACIFIYARFAR